MTYLPEIFKSFTSTLSRDRIVSVVERKNNQASYSELTANCMSFCPAARCTEAKVLQLPTAENPICRTIDGPTRLCQSGKQGLVQLRLPWSKN